MSSLKRPLKLLAILLVLAGMVLVLAWFAGVFHEKVAPAVLPPGGTPVGDSPLLTVQPVTVEILETAVGSVRAVRETAVGSRLLARVVKVHVKAGSPVAEGDGLLDLDDQDIRSKVAQAEQAAKAAEAAAGQTAREEERSGGLFRQKLLAPNDWDRVQALARAAQAELARALEALEEARTLLSFTQVKAPIAGVVVDKHVDVGDMASPGQVLVTIYDPKRMQLWAMVRESLALGLAPGARVRVEIPVVAGICEGRVDEIVPASEVASRTFLVKVSGPCPPGLYKGMYGKLLLPAGSRQELQVPLGAVGRVGQLAQVLLAGPDGFLRRRLVQLGEERPGGRVVVLSGLNPGDQILESFAAAAGGRS